MYIYFIMINELIIPRLIDSGLKQLQPILEKCKAALSVSPHDVHQSLASHFQESDSWAKYVEFFSLKDTEAFHVPLDIYLYPKREREDPELEIEKVALENLLDSHTEGHMVLLGGPGSGKTTSMKHLYNLVAHQDTSLVSHINCPIVIRLRELSAINNLMPKSSETKPEVPSVIYNQLFNIFGFKLLFEEANLSSDQHTKTLQYHQTVRKIVHQFLSDFPVLLILDGFDEVSPNHCKTVLEEIRTLTYNLNGSTIIVTARTGSFDYTLTNVKKYEICPLSKCQMKALADKVVKTNADEFLVKIEQSPFFDTTIRPLILFLLCVIYNQIGEIPDKPKTVYRRVVNLFLEKWDQERSVKRGSQYAKFDADRKADFLSHLAFNLTVAYGSAKFDTQKLITIYNKIYKPYGFSVFEADSVVKEIESHTGLFIQAGIGAYEFSHKSIQEYLTAEYIVKLPKPLDNKEVMSSLPNELAIAVAISSHPTEYLRELLYEKILEDDCSAEFLSSFTERLVMEKPDFEHSDESVIIMSLFYSYLIEKLQPSSDVPNKFSPYVEKCIFMQQAMPLAPYYTAEHDSHRNKKNCFLLRQLKKPHFKSPKNIWLPRGVLTLFT